MAKRLPQILLLLILILLPAILLAQTRPTTTATKPVSPVLAPATTTSRPVTPATQAADVYSLSADAFFKLPEPGERVKKDSVNIPLLEAAVFHQTNRMRAEQKLPLFKHGNALNLMARRHSAEMSDLQFFDHTSPTPGNRSLGDRLKNVGLVNVTAGENIAVLPAKEIGSGHYITHDAIDGNEVWLDEATGKPVEYYTYQSLAETVVLQWKNSPSHWTNIIDKRFLYLGVGIARGPYDDKHQDSFYMTQNFCATVVPAAEEKAKTALNPKH